MIDMSKTYRYRNGEPARILCVDAPGPQPVISLTKDGVVRFHESDGNFIVGGGRESKDRDLIEVREPRTIWVNEYASGLGQPWDTEEQAKHQAVTSDGVVAAIATRKFVEVKA